LNDDNKTNTEHVSNGKNLASLLSDTEFLDFFDMTGF